VMCIEQRLDIRFTVQNACCKIEKRLINAEFTEKDACFDK